MNVHPADLEEAMTKLPGVRGCVVVPCETISGPEPVAVVLFSGSDSDLNVLVRSSKPRAGRVSAHSTSTEVASSAVPIHLDGEAVAQRGGRVGLCDAFEFASRTGPRGSPAGADVLLNMIAEITGESSPGVMTTLRLSEDLHLDSLGRVQLQSALEQQLGLELEDDAIVGVETLGDLRALLERKEGTGLRRLISRRRSVLLW